MALVKLATTSEFDVSGISVPPEQLSDECLIERFKHGDTYAYGQIMRRHNQRLYSVARSIVKNDADALDIVQEAHIKAYRRIDDYHGNGQFAAWLAVITRNQALSHLRKYRQEGMMTDKCADISNIAEGRQARLKATPGPQAEMENKELRALLNKNVDLLPADFRTVFVLRAVEQFSVQETAEILEIKPETVKTRLFRARRLLRNQIEAALEKQGLQVYQVGGAHCDALVRAVLLHMKAGQLPSR